MDQTLKITPIGIHQYWAFSLENLHAAPVYYPGVGGRHELAQHLAGGLAHAGWTREQGEWLVRIVAQVAGDPEVGDRVRFATDTFAKFAAGEPVTGWPRVAEVFGDHGEAIVKAVRKWLGIAKGKGKKGGGEGRQDGASTRIVRMVEAAQVELFHDADEAAYAAVLLDNSARVCWPVRSSAFRRWLAAPGSTKRRKQPSAPESLADALTVIEGKALFEGPECRVWLRLAEAGDKLYLDLADEAGRAVEIDSAGWRLVTSPPVRFPRRRASLPLPVPVAGGSLALLRALVNVREGDWWLLLAWLFSCFRPNGPFPLLALNGEQGSAKTTAGKLLQRLIDPTSGDLRAEPKEARDLMIAATGAWLVAYDNLSRLREWLSDCLCRLATGGGFSTRQLYSDDEEKIFTAQRPVLLTSIEDVVVADDLLDRSVRVALEPIPREKRRTESELWGAFDRSRSRILGAILDAVSGEGCACSRP